MRAFLVTIISVFSTAPSPATAQQKVAESKVANNADACFVIPEGTSLVLDALGWRLAGAGRDVMADFLLDLRGGLDAARSGLEPDAPESEIRAAARATTEFIRRRSGLVLSDAQVERLAAMEAEFASGKRRSITSNSLGLIACGALFERIAALTDEEIGRAASSFRVASVNSIDDSRDLVTLRMNRPSQGLKAEEFIRMAKAFRDGSTPLSGLQRSLVEKAVREEVEWRMNLFARSYPERWGRGSSSGISPVQSLLIVYSTISGDICFSDNALRGTIYALKDAMRRNDKKEQALEGQTAFGARGFIYSTPLDLILSDDAVTRFLDRLDLESRK